MGPSGGGKSSLLAVLGGRSTARVAGTIAFNGRTMDKQVKRKLGYVMQVGRRGRGGRWRSWLSRVAGRPAGIRRAGGAQHRGRTWGCEERW